MRKRISVIFKALLIWMTTALLLLVNISPSHDRLSNDKTQNQSQGGNDPSPGAEAQRTGVKSQNLRAEHQGFQVKDYVSRIEGKGFGSENQNLGVEDQSSSVGDQRGTFSLKHDSPGKFVKCKIY